VQVITNDPRAGSAAGLAAAAAAGAAPAPPAFEPELLVNSKAALPRLVEAIKGAKHVINISMYGWIDSGSGATLARLVEQKAREGVEVNVMLDGRGSIYGPLLPGSRLVKRFREAGINVIVNKSLVPYLDGPVDHCKVYSIDGETGFIGGMNLSKTYDSWHDAMATLDRYGAIQAGRDFLARWTARGGTVSDVNRRLVLQPASEPVRGSVNVIANHPGAQAPITDAYLAAINLAKDRVWVETPFLGSQAMVDALVGAARRGVDVRLLTDGPTTEGAVPGINLLGAGYYGQLVRAGVKVYQQQQMTHSKVLLADEQATVGSFNLTLRSQERHYEISMQSTAPGFVRQVQGMFDADIGVARLVTAADLARPGMKFLEAIHRWLKIQY
jgi:cardiolipin synthase